MTMSDDTITDIDLLAYIDGALDHGRAMAVENYLTQNPKDAARVMSDLRVCSGLRLIFHGYLTMADEIDEASQHLTRKIKQHRRRWRWPKLLGLSGSLLICLSVSIAAYSPAMSMQVNLKEPSIMGLDSSLGLSMVRQRSNDNILSADPWLLPYNHKNSKFLNVHQANSYWLSRSLQSQPAYLEFINYEA